MGFTKLTGASLSKTLGRKLIPLADKLRDLNTKLGIRPYIFSIVRTRWTVGQRGRGEEFLVSRTVIEPTPNVVDMSSLREVIQPIGLDELGGVHVTEISGRYTEEQLRGWDGDGTEPGPGEQVFYEIEFLRPDGQPGEKRRFQLSGVPMYHAGKLQWQISLERAKPDRLRGGDLR